MLIALFNCWICIQYLRPAPAYNTCIRHLHPVGCTLWQVLDSGAGYKCWLHYSNVGFVLYLRPAPAYNTCIRYLHPAPASNSDQNQSALFKNAFFTKQITNRVTKYRQILIFKAIFQYWQSVVRVCVCNSLFWWTPLLNKQFNCRFFYDLQTSYDVNYDSNYVSK